MSKKKKLDETAKTLPSLFFENILDKENKEERYELDREYPLSSKYRLNRHSSRQDEGRSGDEIEILLIESIESEDQNNQKKNNQVVVYRKRPCCEKDCLGALNEGEILDRHRSFVKMNKHEQDICILSQLVIYKINGKGQNSTQGNDKQRTRFDYRFDRDRPLCREAFLTVYGLHLCRLKRLQKLAAANILISPSHGNVGRIPKHAIHLEDAERFQKFLANYADIHGLPDPGRLRRDTREILLPSSDSYSSIWKKYKEGLELLSETEEQPLRVIGYDVFRKLWKQMMPYVKFTTPRTDLCGQCDELKNNIKYAVSAEQTAKLVEDYKDHCDKAKQARELYQQQVNQTRKMWKNFSKKEQNRILASLSTISSPTLQKPCSRNITMHYSFDFAQQVYYPFSCNQRTQEFFKTARKCQVFGVCAEALPRQVFFLIDESEFFGKGSNMVISLLDTFFNLHGLGEKTAQLHADNCTGQNKNNYMIWYLLWRVMNGLHEHISLSFMLPGHTKFAPDAYFGLFKIKYRRSTIDCLQDLVACVESVSQNNHTVPQVYGKHYGLSNNLFELREWNSFLSQYFHPIENILNYNYFDLDHKNPGWVFMRIHSDDEPKSMFLLKQRFFRFSSPAKYPKPSLPKGLSYDRQKYLYKEIRQFVRDSSKQDLTCPKPKD